MWEPFKDSAPPGTAIGNSETNCQHGNEINSAVGIGGTCVCFFKCWTEFPHSLCRSAIVFALVSTRPGRLQASYSYHRAVANISEEFVAPLPIFRRSSLRRCQYYWDFIAPLPTLKNLILGLKYSMRRCKQIPYLFTTPLPTTVCSRGHWQSVCTVGNLFPNCQQPYEMALYL